MKKILSLLSILTISGTAVPATISGSPYKKQEKLNSNINYLQTNNLENLNRNKRENNQINNFSGIVKLFNNINISIFKNDVILKNKTYFGGNKNVEEYDILRKKTKSIINTNGQTTKYVVSLNNKVYFGSSDNNVYEYDTTTNTQKIVIITGGQI